MKKTTVLFLSIIFLLSACGGVRADVADNPQAKAAQSIVEEYIIANETYDPDRLMMLYADNLFWMDYGGNDGPLSRANLDYFVHETMAAKDFKMKVKSYSITPDGRFAALEVDYSQLAAFSGKVVSVTCVVLLEFRDGRIINETWYYNGDVLH